MATKNREEAEKLSKVQKLQLAHQEKEIPYHGSLKWMRDVSRRIYEYRVKSMSKAIADGAGFESDNKEF